MKMVYIQTLYYHLDHNRDNLAEAKSRECHHQNCDRISGHLKFVLK